MIRLVFQVVGLLFLAVALGWLSYDGVRWVVGETAYINVGSIWEIIPQSAHAALQSAFERLADVYLKQPVWLAFAVVGAMLILIARKKKT